MNRTLEDIHRDVDFANRYRLEFIKHCMSLAAAVFVFTVAFIKDIVGNDPISGKWLIGIGWGAMIVSLLAGLGHLAGWDRYYISYRDFWKKESEGKTKRKTINCWRRAAMLLQIAGFFAGLVAIAVFCFKNL